MRRSVLFLLALVVACTLSAMPLPAHHSFGAEYDANRPVTVTGVITKIEWTNPHSFIHLDVKDEKGAVVDWKFEGYPPNVLYRTGWTKDSTIKIGDTVTISGWRAPDLMRSDPGGLAEQVLDGASDLPYAFPNLRVEYCPITTPVPVGYWRSVYASQNCFANESFVDELARASGRDPFELRRELLAGAPRHLKVLELAAEKAGWDRSLSTGRYRGIATHKLFSDTIVAQVAEVSVGGAGIQVHRVVCAVDCGLVVNPMTVEAQIQSAIAFGLSAALHGKITIKDGQVEQSNFHDYPVLRMNEMPKVEVYLVPGGEKPTGVGEPGVPPIAPAVCNALAKLTGKRVRKLPLDDMKWA